MREGYMLREGQPGTDPQSESSYSVDVAQWMTDLEALGMKRHLFPVKERLAIGSYDVGVPSGRILNGSFEASETTYTSPKVYRSPSPFEIIED